MPVADLAALRLEAQACRLALEEAPRDEAATILAEILLRRAPYLDPRAADDLAHEALSGAPHPFDALDQLARRFLAWSGGEAVLVVDPGLRHVRYLLDEDLLLAARVAWHLPPGQATAPLAPPDPWQLAGEPLQPALDQDLADILERQLAETHLHLWGAAPPLIDWLPLMLDLVSLAHKGAILAAASRAEEEERGPLPELTQIWISRLAEAALLRLWLAAAVRDLSQGEHPFRHIERLPALADLEMVSDDRRHGTSDARRTAELVRDLRAALAALGYRRPSDPDAAAIPGCPVWVDPGGSCPFRDSLTQAVLLDMGSSPPKESLALGERVLLASALRMARSPLPRRAPEARRAMAGLLLRYVRIKSAYVRLLFHRGPVRGLDRFRASFGRRAVVWRGANHRARRVWSLAVESYWTQMATLRWMQASTSLPLLPSRLPGSQQRPGTDLRQRLIRARFPDLDRKLELRVTPQLARDFGRTLHAQARGLRDAMMVLAKRDSENPMAAAGKGLGSDVSSQSALPRFQAGLILHLRKDARTKPESHARCVSQICAWLRDHPSYLILVVGLDAASSELDQPPADFVPAFRMAFDEMAQPAGPNRPALSLGMTFHVGEDSRDLLTGIRQVDLAMRLLGLRTSDRLGHALALGFEPGFWYRQRNDIVKLPLGDHLLNMLWARHRTLSGVPLDGRLLQLLDAQLAGLAIRDLDRAQADVDRWLEGRQAFERESALQGRLVAHLPGATLPGHPHERDATSDWIELVSALQDSVARSVAEKGLYIETNPSSNLIISGLTRFEDLPLFRQHPLPGARSVGDQPLRTSISTDDPGLFQTGLREEYALLLAAALKSASHSREEILVWLDKLRDIGYRSSFIRGKALPGERFLDYLLSITG